MNATDEEIYRQLHDWLLNHIRSFAMHRTKSTRRHFELKRIHSLKVADEIAAARPGPGARIAPAPDRPGHRAAP